MKASKPRGVRIKRVYEDPAASDGWRVLVDRLWPRGLRKDEAAFDEWSRDIAPSAPLRKWFGHDPARWTEFRRRYQDELAAHSPELEILRERAKEGPVTLLYGARDPQINHAVVLKEILDKKGGSGPSRPLSRSGRLRSSGGRGRAPVSASHRASAKAASR